jgi:raffinose/stachyose/melibiose transport system substrate-binding protein
MASGNIPDIYFAWSGSYAAQFVNGGRAMDLSDAVLKSAWKDRFAPSLLDPFMFDGKLWGVPINTDAKFMVYNKALFAKAGVSPPANWDEFLAVLKKLKAAGITPIAFGDQAPWAAAHYIGDLNAKLVPTDVRLADYHVHTSDDKLFTDPGYVQALAQLQSFVKEGYFSRGPNAVTHAAARGSFVAGRAAMMYLELVEFATLAGSKLEQDGWDFFPMPGFVNGRGDQKLLTGAPDGFLISSKTQHPKEALAFLDFLTTPEQAALYTKLSGRTAAVKGAVTSDNAGPEVIKGMQALEQAPGLILWLDTDMDPRIVDEYLSGAQALLGGGATPEQVMQKVRDAALKVKQQN